MVVFRIGQPRGLQFHQCCVDGSKFNDGAEQWCACAFVVGQIRRRYVGWLGDARCLFLSFCCCFSLVDFLFPDTLFPDTLSWHTGGAPLPSLNTDPSTKFDFTGVQSNEQVVTIEETEGSTIAGRYYVGVHNQRYSGAALKYTLTISSTKKDAAKPTCATSPCTQHAFKCEDNDSNGRTLTVVGGGDWWLVVGGGSDFFSVFLSFFTQTHPHPPPHQKRYLCLPPRLDGCDLCVSRVAKYGFFVDGRDGRGQFRKQRQPHCCDEAG